MKRSMEKLIDKIKFGIGDLYYCQSIGFVIAGILGTLFVLASFAYTDTTPATLSDYEQLEEKANAIEQNPDLLLKTNCKIEINSEIITVEFENEECKLIAKYNQSFKVLSTFRQDKSTFWVLALFRYSVEGGIIIFVVGWVLTIVIFVLATTIRWILEKVKNKSQNK